MSNGLQVLNMYDNLLGNVGVATNSTIYVQHLFSHQLYQNNNIKTLALFLWSKHLTRLSSKVVEEVGE